MLSLFGLAVFIFLMRWALLTQSRHWRFLADLYPSSINNDVLATRRLQSCVLLGLGGFNTVKGIMTVDVHRHGVTLRMMPLFSFLHPPIYIPYDEIQGWKTTWYLDAPSTELEFSRTPDMKMIVPAELATWLQDNAGYRIALRPERPPQGNAGRGWFAFQLVNVALGLVMVSTMIAVMIWQHTSF